MQFWKTDTMNLSYMQLYSYLVLLKGTWSFLVGT